MKADDNRQHKRQELYKMKRCLQSVGISPLFCVSSFISVMLPQEYVFFKPGISFGLHGINY